MPVHPWMFWLCIIVLLSWIVWLHLPPLSTMSTSYCHSLHLPISLCCYCIIVLLCILELYYCIVLCICIFPFRLQWVPVYFFSSPTCLLVCLYFSCRKDDLFCLAIVYYSLWHCILTLCIITCILPLTLTFLIGNLFASTIVEGSRPCPHPYNIF